MKTHLHPKFTTGSLAEHRLCAIRSTLSSASEYADAGMRGISDAARTSFEYLKRKASGVYEGIFDAWKNNPNPTAEKERTLHRTAEFFRLMPESVHELLEKAFDKKEVPHFSHIDALVDAAKWVNAFEDASIFDDAPGTSHAVRDITILNGPLGIIDSQNADERRKIFHDISFKLISKTITQERDKDNPTEVDREAKIKKAYEATFGDNKKEEERIKFLMDDTKPKRRERAVLAMKGILGMEEATTLKTKDADAHTLAEETLLHHYWRSGMKVKVDLDPAVVTTPSGDWVAGSGVNSSLIEDVEHALETVPDAGGLKDLERDADPSLLKGALRMGIIEASDASNIEDILARRKSEILEHTDKAGKEMDKLTDLSKKENRAKAMDIMSTFFSRSPIEKLATIVFAIIAARKYPGAIMGLGAVYLSQVYLLGHQNPVKDYWSPVLQGMASSFNGLAKGPLGAMGIKLGNESLKVADGVKRVNLMAQFLTKKAREELNSSVTGFALLSDLPLSDLLRHLEISDNTTGLRAALNAHDPEMQRSIKEALSSTGLNSKAFQRFMDGRQTPIRGSGLEETIGREEISQNLLEVGDALMVICYMIAARNPRNKAKVQIIERIRRESPLGNFRENLRVPTTIDGETVNPHKIFMELVREGKNTPPSGTLIDFVESEMGATSAPSARETKETLNRRVEDRKKEVEGHTYGGGVSANLGVEVAENVITVGLKGAAGAGLNHRVTYSKAEFIGKGKEDVLKKWRDSVFTKEKTNLEAVPPGMGLAKFFLIQDGEDIQYANTVVRGAPAGAIAKTSAYKFFTHNNTQIYQKYVKWLGTALPRATGDDAMDETLP